MWVFVFSVPLPYIANQVGWVAAEVGRQPWVVYNLLRTEHGVSKVVGAQAVLGSLIAFTLIYALLFFLFLYLLDRKIRVGPEPVEDIPDKTTAEGLREAVTKRGPGQAHLAEQREDLS
jgi:cytochrome d ubiquinol oxidase subunit I